MGNLFSYFGNVDSDSTHDDTKSVMTDILASEKFQKYQNKFKNLVPSIDVYITEKELIEKHQIMRKTSDYGKSDGKYGFNLSYSITKIEFNWLKPTDIDKMYEYLDRSYDLYDNT